MRYRFGLLIFLAIVILVLGRCTAPDLSAEIDQDLAVKIVASLPQDDIHLRTLAIGEIAGEHGRQLRELLRNEITSSTDFVLVERSQVDHLLEEQKLQAGALVDPQARVRFGELLGAEGIIFGSVTPLEKKWLGRWSGSAQVSLDDVQRGRVVFSREFSSQRISTWNRWFLGAALVIAAYSLLGTFFRRRKARIQHARLDAAAGKRIDAASNLRQARQLLADLQNRAHERGEKQAQTLCEIRSYLADLQQLADVAEYGDPDLQPRRGARKLHSVDKALAEATVSIRRRCEKLARMGRTPDEGTLQNLLDEVRAATTAFRGRSVR